MKKLLVMVILVGLILSLPLFAMGEDTKKIIPPLGTNVESAEWKEILTLKRDLAQERVARLQAQLSLMQSQFAEGQEFLKTTQKELNELNAKLKAMEPKEEKKEKPKVEEKRK